MYRLITSAKDYEITDANGILQSREYKIGTTHVITYDENSNESYDNVDVMTLFKYVNSQGVKIPTYVDNVINNEVSEILKADIEGLKNIIKEVFTRHGTFCNKLKNIDPKYYKEVTVKAICHSAYDIEDQDYFVQGLTCQEVLTLLRLMSFVLI